MIMLISAPLESASRPIAANSFSGMSSGPWRMTSSSGPARAARSAVGTTIDAPIVTSRYSVPAIASAPKSAFG